MPADRGFWHFPEPIDSCSRCGARRPAVIDYACEATVEGDWDNGRWVPVKCGLPAVAVILGSDDGRCREHLIESLLTPLRPGYRLGRNP